MPLRFSILLILLAGCGGGLAACSAPEAPELAQLRAKSCVELVDLRGSVERERQRLDDPKATPDTAYGHFLEIFGARKGPTAQGTTNQMIKERAKVLSDLEAQAAALDKALDEKQCTAAARAKARGTGMMRNAAYDGRYAGQGDTESWCTAPTLSLTLRSGSFTGELTDSSATYEVRGTLYDSGEASFDFRRTSTRRFIEQADGSLADNTLSLVVRVDTSAKACTYRFALKRT